ncbi:hypothetical protein D3C87_1491970 [compost metagenome]
MKTLFQLPIALFLGASTLVLATKAEAAKPQSCFSANQKIAEITKAIAPAFTHNGEMILNLLKSSANDLEACQIESRRAGDGMSLNTCGYSEEVAVHVITIKGKNQTWELVVDENEISCGPKEFLLKDIGTKQGNFVSYITSGDNLIAQVQGCGQESADDYKLVSFQYKDNQESKNVSRLINMNDNLVCPSPTSNEIIIVFSQSKLVSN